MGLAQEKLGLYCPDDPPDTVESLRAELTKARAEINRLKERLGPNHPDGTLYGGSGLASLMGSMR